MKIKCFEVLTCEDCHQIGYRDGNPFCFRPRGGKDTEPRPLRKFKTEHECRYFWQSRASKAAVRQLVTVRKRIRKEKALSQEPSDKDLLNAIKYLDAAPIPEENREARGNFNANVNDEPVPCLPMRLKSEQLAMF